MDLTPPSGVGYSTPISRNNRKGEPQMQNFRNGQVGKGRAMHAVFIRGAQKGQTACGKASNGLIYGEAAITCRSCQSALPSWIGVEIADEHADEMNRAHAEAIAEQAQRTDDAHRAEDLAAPSVNFPAAVALSTWLTEGLVLVGPATDTLLVFERWDGGTAVLTHVESGIPVRIQQADIVNWRYIPGLSRAEAESVTRILAG